MYAIIRTGGKQYQVSPDQVIRVELLPTDLAHEVRFSEVLLASMDDGSVHIGAPLLSGACVLGTVVSHGRGKKIRTIKMKRRKGYVRRYGHRQHFTEVHIQSIHI